MLPLKGKPLRSRCQHLKSNYIHLRCDLAVITGEQLRGARAMLRWEQRRLAEASGVTLETVKRLEAIVGPVSAGAATVDKLRSALEAAGVEFIAENGGGPGVRLRKSQQ